MNKINLVTTFSGYDSQALAMEMLKQSHPDIDYDLVAWCEIDQAASQAHDLIFPQYAGRNVGDITKVDWAAVKDMAHGEEIDLLTYSSPCFVAGTLIQTSEGYKPIEDICKGDEVLTHTNEFHKVVTPMTRLYLGDLYTIDAMCGKVECTDEHPFYVRTRYRKGHKSERAFTEPLWVKAKDLTKDHYLGMPVNKESKLPKWNGCEDNRWGHHNTTNTISDLMTKSDFWYIMGRYLGDGWQSGNASSKGIYIACSDRNKDSLQNALFNIDMPYYCTKERTCSRVQISSREWMEFVERYGKYAYGKHIDIDTLNLPSNLLEAFLNGYMDSDGSVVNGYNKITTVSQELAYGVGQCVAAVHRQPYRLYHTERPEVCEIEGRTCSQRDTYQVCWKEESCPQDKAFYENGYIWFPIRHITSEYAECRVYNMEVEIDNSYIANNIIVHNCQDISQAGKQMGLTQGSDTRSALLWNVVDAIVALKPKYLLQENVKALVSKKFMPDFEKWMAKLDELGYHSKWAVVNAKEHGVPQNRERVFCISWRKDLHDESWEYVFPATKPLETVLADILEDEVDESYYLSDKAVEGFMKTSADFSHNHNFAPKASLEDTGSRQGVRVKGQEDKQENDVAFTIRTKAGGRIDDNFVDESQEAAMGKVKSEERDECVVTPPLGCENDDGPVLTDEVAEEVDANGGKTAEPRQLPPIVVGPSGKEYHLYMNEDTPYYLRIERTTPSNNIEEAGEYVSERTIDIPLQMMDDNGVHTDVTLKIDTVSGVKRFCCSDPNVSMWVLSFRIRKLTNRECFRLMGVQEWAIDRLMSTWSEPDPISNLEAIPPTLRKHALKEYEKAKKDAGKNIICKTQLYKQAGNSIVVDVLRDLYAGLWASDTIALDKSIGHRFVSSTPSTDYNIPMKHSSHKARKAQACAAQLAFSFDEW